MGVEVFQCNWGNSIKSVLSAKNQEKLAGLMKEKKIIMDAIHISEFVPDKFLKSVNLLINDKKFRQAMYDNASKIVNLNGVTKIVENIQKIFICNERKLLYDKFRKK